jgi:hypothetical protein
MLSTSVWLTLDAFLSLFILGALLQQVFHQPANTKPLSPKVCVLLCVVALLIWVITQQSFQAISDLYNGYGWEYLHITTTLMGWCCIYLLFKLPAYRRLLQWLILYLWFYPVTIEWWFYVVNIEHALQWRFSFFFGLLLSFMIIYACTNLIDVLLGAFSQRINALILCVMVAGHIAESAMLFEQIGLLPLSSPWYVFTPEMPVSLVLVNVLTVLFDIKREWSAFYVMVYLCSMVITLLMFRRHYNRSF